MSDFGWYKSGHGHKHRWQLMGNYQGVYDATVSYQGNDTQDHLVTSDCGVNPLFIYIFSPTNLEYWFAYYNNQTNYIITYDVWYQTTNGAGPVKEAGGLTYNLKTRQFNVDPLNSHNINTNPKYYYYYLFGNSILNGGYKPGHHRHNAVIDTEYACQLTVVSWTGDGNNDVNIPNSLSPGFAIIMSDEPNFYLFGNIFNNIVPKSNNLLYENDGVNAASFDIAHKHMYQNSLDENSAYLNSNDDELNALGVEYVGLLFNSFYQGTPQVEASAGHIHYSVPEQCVMSFEIQYYTGDGAGDITLYCKQFPEFWIIITDEPKLYFRSLSDVFEVAALGNNNINRNYITRTYYEPYITMDAAINQVGVTYYVILLSGVTIT